MTLQQRLFPDYAAALLIAHEVAIIAFARAELAGDPDRLEPLRRDLESAAGI